MQDTVYNPFSDEEEIIVKDKDGKIKIVSKGKILGDTSEEKNIPREESASPKEEKSSEYQNFQKIAAEIAKSSASFVADPMLQKRLVAIIVTFLKGIRDIVETREILTRSKDIGGAGFSLEQAEALLLVLEKKSREGAPALGKFVEDIPFVNVSLKKSEHTHDILSEFPKYTVGARREEKVQEVKMPISVEAPRPGMSVSAPPPAGVSRDESFKKPDSAKEDILKLIQELPEYAIVKKASEARANAPVQEKAQPAQADKFLQERGKARVEPEIPEKKAESVTLPEPVLYKPRIPPKLLGPVEELEELDTIEFRRLDKDPKAACRKIEEKIKTLGKDSFLEMTRGISAWRRSFISKLYLELGRESIVKKIPIEKIVVQRKLENKLSLSIEEFEAIMDLNEKIRF